jgi:hypothetical protein
MLNRAPPLAGPDLFSDTYVPLEKSGMTAVANQNQQEETPWRIVINN